MDWITINKTEGRGSAEVKVTAPTYRDLVDRMTRLKISTLSKTAYVNIKQEKFIPIFELSKTKLIFINDIFEENINITSNIEWTATVSNDWITLSSYNGDGNSVLTISVNESDTAERTGSVEFYNSGVLIGTISVTQYDNSFNLFYTEPTEIIFIDTTTENIYITSNRNWTANTDADWITLSSNSGSAGVEQEITITVADYVEDRNTKISFYIDGEKIGEVAIYQTYMPQNCFYIEPLTENGFEVRIDSYESQYVLYTPYYFNGLEWKKMSSNDRLRFYKKTFFKDFNLSHSSTYHEGFRINGLCNIGGNIETLLGEMREGYAFGLFKYCDIVDASNLSLPSHIVEMSSYAYMFDFCEKLVTAPALPATTLAKECYYGMFNCCRSLVNAPALPATTLEYRCYANMFMECISLITAPKLPATELATYCYASMFAYCTSLVNAPELPATELAIYCYFNMFYRCTSLTTAPVLPATTLANSCYFQMFNYCSNLNNITMLATNNLEGGLYDWVRNVSPTGIFYKNPNIDISNFSRGIDGIPEGWEVGDYEV